MFISIRHFLICGASLLCASSVFSSSTCQIAQIKHDAQMDCGYLKGKNENNDKKWKDIAKDILEKNLGYNGKVRFIDNIDYKGDSHSQYSINSDSESEHSRFAIKGDVYPEGEFINLKTTIMPDSEEIDGEKNTIEVVYDEHSSVDDDSYRGLLTGYGNITYIDMQNDSSPKYDLKLENVPDNDEYYYAESTSVNSAGYNQQQVYIVTGINGNPAVITACVNRNKNRE